VALLERGGGKKKSPKGGKKKDLQAGVLAHRVQVVLERERIRKRSEKWGRDCHRGEEKHRVKFKLSY